MLSVQKKDPADLKQSVDYGHHNMFTGNMSVHQGGNYFSHGPEIANPAMHRNVLFRIPPKVKECLSGAAIVAFIADSIVVLNFLQEDGFPALFHHSSLLIGLFVCVAIAKSLWPNHLPIFWHFPKTSINFESEDGATLVTQYYGECPRCKHQLHLVDIGPEGDLQTYSVCTENPNHKWLFDHTTDRRKG